MKILVIGSGGREHALAWKLAQSNKVSTVFVAPGNAGIAQELKVKNIHLIQPQDLIQFCQQESIDLTVVGPETPLSEGIVDIFQQTGLKIFGPTKLAAQLESSKDYAKQFMQKYHIPTANYKTFSDAVQAKEYVVGKGVPIVIKADGLAAGKGVVVASTLMEANQAIDDMLLNNKLGNAGAKVVIEDFLAGEEVSFIAMADGKHILPMATSQDYKRLFNGDNGPNTGGMGAYSPALVVTETIFNKVLEKIIQPTVAGMRQEGHPFTGFLYAGLMIDQHGDPYTIEFNCRLGDPETQPIMMRLKTDLVDLLEAAGNESLHKATIDWDPKVAVAVVLATKDYPQSSGQGDIIYGLKEASQLAKIFHAGTTLRDDQLVTNGGRVLCLVGMDEDVKEAKAKVYQAVKKIYFNGIQYRTDVADKAIV